MHNQSNECPLVSVITPNFNGFKFIPRLIESVRQQNYPVEHIIVDDCSTDGSWELLLEISKKYNWLKLVRLDKNSGPVVARNKAIEIASGRYLAFLDVDDFWLSSKLKTQISFMQKTTCALSFSDYRFVAEDGASIGRRLRGVNSVGWHLHHMTRYLGCLTIVVDRNILPEFHFPQTSSDFFAEDFLAWSNCIKQVGAALRCPHDLARYAVVSNSRSSNGRRASRSVWKLYREVEGIYFPTAIFYFVIYAIGVVWKRFWYRPYFRRDAVDMDFEWSLLP